MSKRKANQEKIQQLYTKLSEVSEIPVIESSDIHSKGLYMTRDGKSEIYIKQSLSIKEKIKVLLHEYSHHIHLTHYIQDESRSECEIIANAAAFFVCSEYGLNIYKAFDLSKFSNDTDVVARLTATVQTVTGHIIRGIEQV